jgi:hypothetical protein
VRAEAREECANSFRGCLVGRRALDDVGKRGWGVVLSHHDAHISARCAISFDASRSSSLNQSVDQMRY